MTLDALVTRQLAVLCGRRLDDAAFALPRHIVHAMTVAVEPAPLYFADAIATIANVRPDAHPQANVASLTLCLAYIDAAYGRYIRERAEYLRSPAGASIPGGAAELARILRRSGNGGGEDGVDDGSPVRHAGLEPDDLVPLFNYIVAKSTIDHPVLCAVLCSMWLQQQGLGKGRDGFALSMFKAACAWAASFTF